jgi:hypothetical protein
MRDDLTAWDYVPEFTGQQAALAIVGLPPTDDPAALLKVAPVLERLRDAYEATRRWYADAPAGGDTPPHGLVVSVEMQTAQGRISTELASIGAGDWRFLTWLRTPMADFDRQVFTRDVLARWVQEVGASSLYPFTSVQAQAAATPKPMQHHKAQEKEQFTSVEDKRRTLKKAALIIEHRNEWPTIEEDLREAARNGLSTVRVDGSVGWYYVEDARRWAEERGKLQKSSAKLSGNSIFSAAGRVHSMGD